MDEHTIATGDGRGHPYTLLYASPEQLVVTSPLGPASDQYSLGLVLFEMLTGKPYKDLTEEERAAALRRHPSGVAAVVARMTAEEERARYGSLGEVVAAIETLGPEVRAWEAAQTVPGPPPKPLTLPVPTPRPAPDMANRRRTAREAGVPTPAPAPAPAKRDAAVSSPPPSRPAPRLAARWRRAWIGKGALVAMAMIAGILIVALHRSNTDAGVNTVTYHNAQDGYRLEYPQGWTGYYHSELETWSGASNDPYPLLFVGVTPLQGSLAATADTIRTNVLKPDPDGTYTCEPWNDTRLAGEAAKVMRCTYVRKDSPDATRIERRWLVVHNGKAYILGSQEQPQSGQIDGIVRSFTFTD